MADAVSRRALLGATAGAVAIGAATTGATSAAGANTGDAAVAGAATDGMPATGETLPVRSHFAGREGQHYDGASHWSAHRLVLREVGDLTPAGADAEHAFRLRFEADADARDGLYRLTASDGAEHALFLNRVGQPASLEAIVHRT